jgi:hypothetical protein
MTTHPDREQPQASVPIGRRGIYCVLPKERTMSNELLTFSDLPNTDKPWKIY